MYIGAELYAYCSFGYEIHFLDALYGAALGYDWLTGHIYHTDTTCDTLPLLQRIYTHCKQQVPVMQQCNIPVNVETLGDVCGAVRKPDLLVTWRCLPSPPASPTVLPLPSRPTIQRGKEGYPTTSAQVQQVSVPTYAPSPADRGLMVYVFYNDHENYMNNLLFFLDCCVRAWHNMDYIFLIQEHKTRVVDVETLPPLPPNARYYIKPNQCLDFGSVGWLLRLQGSITDKTHPLYIDIEQYAWFILKNGGCVGPFLVEAFTQDTTFSSPPINQRLSWYYHYLYKMARDYEVKLAGTTISCERNVHVQGWFLVSDRIGWELTKSHPLIYACTITDTVTMAKVEHVINGSEIGGTLWMLHNGYNVASNMLVYDGVDWRDRSLHGCQGAVDSPNTAPHIAPIAGTKHLLVNIEIHGEIVEDGRRVKDLTVCSVYLYVYSLDVLEVQVVKWKDPKPPNINNRRAEPWIQWRIDASERRKDRIERQNKILQLRNESIPLLKFSSLS